MTLNITHSLLACAALAACSSSGTAPQSAAAPSPYSEQHTRPIKSLSETDVDELRAGKGWGFAKPAELNGVPGPVHVLELADDLELTADQRASIGAVFDRMHARARQLGAEFVDAERRLSEAFEGGAPSLDTLRALVATSTRAREQLRLAHLEAHVESAPLLRADQRDRYIELRGYAAADPCASPPPGHDPAVWRRHHDCR